MRPDPAFAMYGRALDGYAAAMQENFHHDLFRTCDFDFPISSSRTLSFVIINSASVFCLLHRVHTTGELGRHRDPAFFFSRVTQHRLMQRMTLRFRFFPFFCWIAWISLHFFRRLGFFFSFWDHRTAFFDCCFVVCCVIARRVWHRLHGIGDIYFILSGLVWSFSSWLVRESRVRESGVYFFFASAFSPGLWQSRLDCGCV
jgi:hypothetical protein